MIGLCGRARFPLAYSLVIATHLSMCAECRAAYEAHAAVGGALLETEDTVALPDHIKGDLLARLDEPMPSEPPQEATPPYPGPIARHLGATAPKWRSLGYGVKQAIIASGRTGSARLLSIPGGVAVPDHSHGGLELTLVLQGSFRDESGVFGVGDLEVADEGRYPYAHRRTG